MSNTIDFAAEKQKRKDHYRQFADQLHTELTMLCGASSRLDNQLLQNLKQKTYDELPSNVRLSLLQDRQIDDLFENCGVHIARLWDASDMLEQLGRVDEITLTNNEDKSESCHYDTPVLSVFYENSRLCISTQILRFDDVIPPDTYRERSFDLSKEHNAPIKIIPYYQDEAGCIPHTSVQSCCDMFRKIAAARRGGYTTKKITEHATEFQVTFPIDNQTVVVHSLIVHDWMLDTP